MEDKSLPAQQHRIGFHYFSDTLHYRDSDLIRWLPELLSLGASWITLNAPDDHAIPEPFISGLIKANIQPILHFRPSTSRSVDIEHLKPLLTIYARWGVRHVVFFDRPNQLSNWSPAGWAQDKLVERFLDLFLPCAEAALFSGLTPVLPPLEPGGNYWDTAFLRDLFAAVNRRGYASLLNHLSLSAYARAGNRPLNWGAGGPERWPSTKPYFTPKDSQDQRGFRIFDWYLAISNASLGKSLPIMLFGAGCHPGDSSDPQHPPITPETHAARHVEIARALAGQESELEAIPAEVIACNYWPIFSAPGYPEASKAWFQVNGITLPVVESMRNWAISHKPVPASAVSCGPGRFNPHPIAHYLLLTEELWTRHGINSTILRAFLQKYKPTIGFSAVEAAFAHRVTIFGSILNFPEVVVDQLTAAGCLVERILEDGTVIAPSSAEA